MTKKPTFKVESRYGSGRDPSPDDAPVMIAWRWRDTDHTPYNKRSGQVESSRATLSVTAAFQGLSIELSECTQATHGGNFIERIISVSLDADARAALLDYLLNAPQ